MTQTPAPPPLYVPLWTHRYEEPQAGQVTADKALACAEADKWWADANQGESQVVVLELVPGTEGTVVYAPADQDEKPDFSDEAEAETPEENPGPYVPSGDPGHLMPAERKAQ